MAEIESRGLAASRPSFIFLPGRISVAPLMWIYEPEKLSTYL